jgi:hypothetical protein
VEERSQGYIDVKKANDAARKKLKVLTKEMKKGDSSYQWRWSHLYARGRLTIVH